MTLRSNNQVWEKGILGEDVDIKGRIGWKGYKKSDLRQEGPVVIGGVNVKNNLFLDLSEVKHISREKFEESPEIILQAGDVLIVQRGNGIGDVAYYDGHLLEATINPTLIILSNFIGDSRFLFYYLSSKQGRESLLSLSSGSSVPAIYQNPLKTLLYPKPSISEQKMIADFLSAFDNKINLNHHLNALLEQTAQAIFQSWFVDFDPVRAKVRAVELGCDPELAAMGALSGKLSIPKNIEELTEEDLRTAEERIAELKPAQRKELAETARLFPAAFVESELGLVPEGWEVSTIGNETSTFGGATPSTKNSEYWEGGLFSWATPKDLSNVKSLVLLETGRKLTRKGVEKISSGQLPKGTVLLSSRAPVGYTAIAQIPISINQGFIALVCDGRLPNSFVLHWLRQKIEEIKGRASGSTFAEISKKDFRPIQCIVPSVNLLKRYDLIASVLISSITLNESEKKHLIGLRDTLLPKLISGEISVEGLR